MKWSGCNYHINQGNNEHEPIGTAQSMHDCDGCEKVNHCPVAQDEPTWKWNEEIEKDLQEKWKMFNSN